MYFLAIVGDPDIRVGNWVPSYVLCRSNSNSPNRSGWRVVDANGKHKNAPKILVRTIYDKQVMIDFMSKFRTRKHRHNSKRYAHKYTKKFYPRGMLCWFECDKFGRPLGHILAIKRVPDMKARTYDDQGKNIIDAELKKVPTLLDVLTQTPMYTDLN